MIPPASNRRGRSAAFLQKFSRGRISPPRPLAGAGPDDGRFTRTRCLPPAARLHPVRQHRSRLHLARPRHQMRRRCDGRSGGEASSLTRGRHARVCLPAQAVAAWHRRHSRPRRYRPERAPSAAAERSQPSPGQAGQAGHQRSAGEEEVDDDVNHGRLACGSTAIAPMRARMCAAVMAAPPGSC